MHARSIFIITSLVVVELMMAPIFTYAVEWVQGGTSVTESVNISVTIEQAAATPTPTPTPTPGGGSGGGGTILPPTGETTVVLQGKAYPGAFITVLKNGQVSSTLVAEITGMFEVTFSGIQEGIYSFGVFAKDAKDRKSLTLTFTINVIKDAKTTVSGIFIPPTITTDRSVFHPDESLDIDGYAFPNSDVRVVLNSAHEIVESAPSGPDGAWVLSYPLAGMALGDHSSRARVRSGDGDQSEFSETRLFQIVPKSQPLPSTSACHGGDLNNDGRVNITDFSILLFWWQSRNAQHPCVDINKDGIVNLTDFSLMMYQWTR